jgi:hypothetical protein
MDSATIARQLADYDAKRVTSTDAMNQALAQYGVPEIRNTVSGLRTTLANTTNALNSVDPSVTGRTQGSLVTEAQRQRQVARERAPIAGQLDSQGKQLGDAQTNLNDALGQATTLATNRVNDWNAGRQALQGQYDNTYKREQDTLAQQLAQEQMRRDQTNGDRQFALQSMKASSGGGGGNQSMSKQQVTAAIRQGLESVKGRDNHVAPADLARAHSDWLNSGLSDKDFWAAFQGYWNPKQANYKDQFNAAH